MSVHDEGYGDNTRPALEFESDLANRFRSVGAQDDRSWGANAHTPHRSEEPFMNSGANKPGQPMMGQRSIFGTGRGPVFAQVPAYTPVTRGSELQPQHRPEPPKSDYGAYARQGQPMHTPSVSGYASPNGAPPSYQGPSAPARTYTTPDFPNPFPPQSYQPQSQPPQKPQAQPSQPSIQPADSYQPEPSPARSFQDTGFPDRIFPAYVAPNTGYAEQSFAAANYRDANFGDASFPDAGFPDASFEDASFPEEKTETGFAGAPSHGDAYSEHESLHLDDAAAPYDTDSEHDPLADLTQQGSMGAGPRPLPSHQALQTFDAVYDQPPQIALGGIKYPQQSAPQGFYEGEQPDADFLDERQFTSGAEDAGLKLARELGLRSRSIFMVGSALLGAVALGGALAYAYKQSGGPMGGGAQPPVVQADSRPVKELPQQTSGKDSPHKNKLIYERLQNGDQPEAEHIVPRQEDVAIPAMPGAAPMAAPGAAPSAPSQVATVDDPNSVDGGPRRVKTLVVHPDGSVMPAAAPPAQPTPQPQQAAPAQAAPASTPQQMAEPAIPAPSLPQPQAAPAAAAVPAAAPAPVAADPQPVAAIPPAKPRVAAADAGPAPAKPSQYVVQVGSKQNQTEALATFADMQQKYPTLLANYRPMVQKADLGAKGVWYRLRIGPIVDKTAAAKLCSQLKSQGHPDCLVTAAQ
jgi:SPOR domain